jgi:kinesin light chain
MSQDDILQSTKSVIQGLDALKNEHGKMLESIVTSPQKFSPIETNKLEEKVGLLRKSMDMIELGLSFKKNKKIQSFLFFSSNRNW